MKSNSSLIPTYGGVTDDGGGGVVAAATNGDDEGGWQTVKARPTTSARKASRALTVPTPAPKPLTAVAAPTVRTDYKDASSFRNRNGANKRANHKRHNNNSDTYRRKPAAPIGNAFGGGYYSFPVDMPLSERLQVIVPVIPRVLMDIIMQYRGSVIDQINELQSFYSLAHTRFNEYERHLTKKAEGGPMNSSKHDDGVDGDGVPVPMPMQRVRKFWNNSMTNDHWRGTCIHFDFKAFPFEEGNKTEPKKNGQPHEDSDDEGDSPSYREPGPLTDYQNVTRPSDSFSARSCARCFVDRAKQMRVIDGDTEWAAHRAITSTALRWGYTKPEDGDDEHWWTEGGAETSADRWEASLTDNAFYGKELPKRVDRLAARYADADQLRLRGLLEPWRMRRAVARPVAFVKFIRRLSELLCEAESCGEIRCYVGEQYEPPLTPTADCSTSLSFYDLWVCQTDKLENTRNRLKALNPKPAAATATKSPPAAAAAAVAAAAPAVDKAKSSSCSAEKTTSPAPVLSINIGGGSDLFKDHERDSCLMRMRIFSVERDDSGCGC